jgi:hypothetical protein
MVSGTITKLLHGVNIIVMVPDTKKTVGSLTQLCYDNKGTRYRMYKIRSIA